MIFCLHLLQIYTEVRSMGARVAMAHKNFQKNAFGTHDISMTMSLYNGTWLAPIISFESLWTDTHIFKFLTHPLFYNFSNYTTIIFGTLTLFLAISWIVRFSNTVKKLCIQVILRYTRNTSSGVIYDCLKTSYQDNSNTFRIHHINLKNV